MKTEKIEYINSRSWHKVIKGRIINIPARISKYYSRKNQYSLLRNALPEFAHGNIISIGYGGEISKVLDGENIKYTSIDITGSPDVLCDVQDMRVFKEESVDTIICMSVLAEVENPIKAVSEFKRILKPNGVVLLYATQPFATALINSNPKWFKYDWVWIKTQAANFQLAKKMPLKKHEYILVFSKVGFNKVWNDINNKPKSIYNPQMTYSTEINHRFNKGKEKSENMKLINKRKVEPIYKSDPNKDVSSRYPKELIYFPVPYKSKRFHPTQKPVELLEYLIKTYTNKGMTILDNTMGSGSTGVAAKMLQRNFIGIEKELNYFEIAQKRIDNTIIETSIFDCA